MKPSKAQIDQLLPQTQCGLCGYGGCMPYAQAMLEGGAEINLCPPGGVDTLKNLGKLLNIDPIPHIPEMEKAQKPAQKVVIREDECIGCTKCIQACPVDAIMGASKQMHTIISSECTGCELCIEPCPVDCIDIIPGVPHSPEKARQRYTFREARLERDNAEKKAKHQASKSLRRNDKESIIEARKAAIQASVARVKAKKSL